MIGMFMRPNAIGAAASLAAFAIATLLRADDDPVRSIASALRTGHAAEAVTLATQRLAADPDNVRILTLLGIGESQLQHGSAAISAFRRALRSDPDYLPALEGAASAEFEANKPEAAADVDHLLRVRPEDVTAHAMRGVLFARAGDCSAALPHFASAGAAVAGHAASAHGYAVCLLSSGRFEDAVALLRPLADGTPTDPSALALLSEAYEALQDTPQAVQALRSAIVAAPDRPRLYVQFADLCFAHKSFQVGIDMIDAGLQRLPHAADLYLARAVLLVQEGRYDAADRDFAQAETLDPGRSTGVSAQALAQMQADHLDDALATVRGSLEQHPADAMSWYVLAEVQLRRGAHVGTPEFAQALRAVQNSVRLDRRFVAARNVLSRLLLESGDVNGAVATARETLSIQPLDETALYHLIRALKRRDRTGDVAEIAALTRRLAAVRELTRSQEQAADRFRLEEQP